MFVLWCRHWFYFASWINLTLTPFSRISSEEDGEEGASCAAMDDNLNNQACNRTVACVVHDVSPSSDQFAHRRRAISLKVVVGNEEAVEYDPEEEDERTNIRITSCTTGHDADVESGQDDDDGSQVGPPSSPPRYIRKRSASLGANFCYRLPEQILRFKAAKMLGISDSEVFASVYCKPTKTSPNLSKVAVCGSTVNSVVQQVSPRLNVTAKWRNQLPKMCDYEEDDDEVDEEAFFGNTFGECSVEGENDDEFY